MILQEIKDGLCMNDGSLLSQIQSASFPADRRPGAELAVVWGDLLSEVQKHKMNNKKDIQLELGL